MAFSFIWKWADIQYQIGQKFYEMKFRITPVAQSTLQSNSNFKKLKQLSHNRSPIPCIIHSMQLGFLLGEVTMDFQEDMARVFIIIYFTISQLWFEICFSFAFNFDCLISVVCFRVTWRTFQPKPKKTKKNDPEKNSSYFRKWNSLALILKKFLYLQKLNPALYSLNHQNLYIL